LITPGNKAGLKKEGNQGNARLCSRGERFNHCKRKRTRKKSRDHNKKERMKRERGTYFIGLWRRDVRGW